MFKSLMSLSRQTLQRQWATEGTTPGITRAFIASEPGKASGHQRNGIGVTVHLVQSPTNQQGV